MTNLLKEFFQLIVDYIAQSGYWGIGIGMALESACFPIPSEIILPFGGYLVSGGQLQFWGTVAAGTLGGTVGSILAYLIGLKGGRPFIINYGRYFFVSSQHLQKAESWFARYGEATAFFSRLLPIIRTFISLPCGVAKMKFPKFVLYTFLGSLPWSIALTYAGLKMGEHWQEIRTWFHQIDIAMVIILVVFLLVHLLKRNNNRGSNFL